MLGAFSEDLDDAQYPDLTPSLKGKATTRNMTDPHGDQETLQKELYTEWSQDYDSNMTPKEFAADFINTDAETAYQRVCHA